VARGIAERLGLGELPIIAQEGPHVDAGGAQGVLARLDRDRCTLSLDSSGDHLHRRGYRTEALAAPLRENLAASLLRLCGWQGERGLADPMCGSGTIPIEAALMAARRAPGLERHFAFENWPGFDADLWRSLVDKARDDVHPPVHPILASDRDPEAVAITRRNAERAGVSEWIETEAKPVSELAVKGLRGLVLCNPPYGQRMRDEAVAHTYEAFGRALRRQPKDWDSALVTSKPRLARATGQSATAISAPFPNGGTRVRLYRLGHSARP
jgi:putative N6-adenine-specific DNA methylase